MFYVVFNVVLVVLLIGFIDMMVWLCVCILLGGVYIDDFVVLCYFDFFVLVMLMLVLGNVVCEVLCIGDCVEYMFDNILCVFKINDVCLL